MLKVNQNIPIIKNEQIVSVIKDKCIELYYGSQNEILSCLEIENITDYFLQTLHDGQSVDDFLLFHDFIHGTAFGGKCWSVYTFPNGDIRANVYTNTKTSDDIRLISDGKGQYEKVYWIYAKLK